MKNRNISQKNEELIEELNADQAAKIIGSDIDTFPINYKKYNPPPTQIPPSDSRSGSTSSFQSNSCNNSTSS
jgi:hypothetical protein